MLLNSPVDVRRGADVDGLTNDVIAGRDKCRATWDKRENMKVVRQMFEVERTEERMKKEQSNVTFGLSCADAWLRLWCLPIAVHGPVQGRPGSAFLAPF